MHLTLIRNDKKAPSYKINPKIFGFNKEIIKETLNKPHAAINFNKMRARIISDLFSALS